MEAIRPSDKDATLGLDQSYLPLHIRRLDLDGTPCMESLWRPTADELALLNAGAVVSLKMLGTAHPPVKLEVPAPPPPQAT